MNLLPPRVVARRAVRRAQRGAAAGVAAALLVVTGAWLVGSANAADEQEQLDVATSRVTALQAQQAQYAAAPETLRALRAAEAARASAMAQDVQWAAFVDSLSRALPAGAWFDGVQAALASDTTDPSAAGAAGAAGAITITARATSYEDVAGYLDALAAVPGVSDPYLSTASLDETQAVPVVSFTVTAQVDDEALSHRFDQTDDTQEAG